MNGRKQIQTIVDEIDNCIKNYNDEALTLRLPFPAGWAIPSFIQPGKFKEISGMSVSGLSAAQKAGLCA